MFVCMLVSSVRGFETEQKFEDFVRKDPQSDNVLAAVVFEHAFSRDDEALPLQVNNGAWGCLGGVGAL